MRFIILFSFIISFIKIFSQEPVFQWFEGKDYDPVQWDKIERIILDDKTRSIKIEKVDEEPTIKHISEGFTIMTTPTLPLIEIITEESLTEIPNKTDYQKAQIKLEGFGEYENLDRSVNIKGRGNTSWAYPKKPYRLKFDKKVSLCGLPAAKNYVLLANYTDASLLQNRLAFKIGHMLDLPYTNEAVAVDVKLNGNYKGSYILTNKPGINAGSVDIDEDESIMWELDLAYDEDYKFMSPILNLPVMVSDPDLTDEQFEYWKEDFIRMEKAAVELKAAELVDLDILARYVLVNEILKNDEIGWPKSVKLFKSKDTKYIFGPIWDFDNSMGKVWAGESYTTDDIGKSVWKNRLIGYLEDDPFYKSAIANHWSDFRKNKDYLLDFINLQSQQIKNSAYRNRSLWPEMEDFDISINKMKYWLEQRFIALDTLYLK